MKLGKVLVLLSLFASPVVAQDFPSKQITVVVPFTAGGGNDTIARFMSQELSKVFDKPVIVENRPGGGTAIGSAYVSRAKPDGHTLLFASSSYLTNAAYRDDLPFDPRKDLIPVSIVGEGYIVLLAGPALNVKTFDDLKKVSKEKDLFFGITGTGSNAHFYSALVSKALDAAPTLVTYPGGGETIVDMIGGRLDITAGAYTPGERHLDKGIVALAQLSNSRSATMPDVPTMVELGYPDAVGEHYWTVFAPSGTPDDVVQKLKESIAGVMNTASGREFLATLDVTPPSEALQKDVQLTVTNSIDRWENLAKGMGLAK